MVEESLANVTQGNGRKPLFDIKKTEKNFKVDFGEESLQYVGKVCFIRFRIIQSDTDHLFSSSSDDGLWYRSNCPGVVGKKCGLYTLKDFSVIKTPLQVFSCKFCKCFHLEPH